MQEEEPRPLSLQSTRLNILVVDDDESLRALLRLHLANAGYCVTEAEDALVAGRRLLKFTPDLLIVDIDLPYLNGLEFVRALRADRTLPFVPVVFITAHERLAEQAATLEAEILVKPFFKDQLLACAAKSLGRHAVAAKAP